MEVGLIVVLYCDVNTIQSLSITKNHKQQKKSQLCDVWYYYHEHIVLVK